jgi:sugar O-acyltransferase (sialic acid O-acetyltransferase NeuD family)
MKQLIIIGGGGMGRSVYCIAQGCYGYGDLFEVKGFLDDNLHSLDGFKGYPPIVGTIDEYDIQKDDVFICSIGDTKIKKMVCEKLKMRGASFISLVHKTAIIRQNAFIGNGSIVADYAHVGADCSLGEHSLLQSYAITAHDCTIGNYVRIDTHCVCVGGIIIEEGAKIHTGAVISHNVVVGAWATVGATSLVIKKVKSGTTVFGNPAILLA